MKKLIYALVACFVLGSSGLYANSQQMRIQAETIKTISQEITKNYFYVQQGVQSSFAKKGLKKNILALDSSIKKLQKNAKNSETKRVIEFMFFGVDELKSTIRGKFSAENGGLILDYTEVLLEGSESILSKNNKGRENMLDVVEEMEFLLERASKYYIAFRAGYTDEVNVKQAQDAVKKFDKLLVKVRKYSYPSTVAKGPVKKLLKYWPVSKNFYLGIKNSELPTIVFISTKHMKKALDKLVMYHKI